MLKGKEIEKESFIIIEGQMSKKTFFSEQELKIVKRVIHATGDFDYENIIRLHSYAIESGINAIQKGMDILTDVKMVSEGINKKYLEKHRNSVHCFIAEPDVYEMAETRNITRAEAAVEKAVSSMGKNIGIAVVGNAPTALLKTLELMKTGAFSPNLVIGVPVGFVKAVESKDELHESHFAHITCLGTKGGSGVAAAIINAILSFV